MREREDEEGGGARGEGERGSIGGRGIMTQVELGEVLRVLGGAVLLKRD